MQRGPAPKYELTFQDVLDILKLIDTSRFEDLEIQVEDLRVKVSRRASPGGVASPPRPGPSEAEPGPSTGESAAAGRVREVAPAQTPQPASGSGGVGDLSGMVEVKPPMAGTFYRAPAPGAPPFVEAGRPVKSGDTLGVVEVMKLFTPVHSPCDGTVREILANNESFVSSDQVLMIIQPASEP